MAKAPAATPDPHSTGCFQQDETAFPAAKPPAAPATTAVCAEAMHVVEKRKMTMEAMNFMFEHLIQRSNSDIEIIQPG
jgi:hypothetical protein